jgi:hypothetical protein
MKARSIRAAVLSALVLTSPAFIFAAGQPKLHTLSKAEMQDLSGATPAVKQGKGAGLSRNYETPRSADFHLTTAKERVGDSAIRK